MKLFLKTFLAIGMLATTQIRAQSKSHIFTDFFAFDWEISKPTDNNFLNETSLSGWRLEYRRMVKPNLSVGLGVSWSSFDEYFTTQTYKGSNGRSALTADMIRQVYTVPITLITHYYLKTGSSLFQPYVGLGLGTQYAESNAYFNIYVVNDNNWGFVARPEIGTLINFGPSPAKALVTFGYNWSTNKNDAFDIKNINQFVVNVGIGIAN